MYGSIGEFLDRRSSNASAEGGIDVSLCCLDSHGIVEDRH